MTFKFNAPGLSRTASRLTCVILNYVAHKYLDKLTVIPCIYTDRHWNPHPLECFEGRLDAADIKATFSFLPEVLSIKQISRTMI